MLTKKLLIVSNLITFALFVIIAFYYRVPQKLCRTWVIERRIQGITPSFAINRNYQSSREIFQIYHGHPNPILIFGDSHVRLISWQELLGINNIASRGIDGDTLEGVTARLVDESESNPSVVVILAGTNNLLRGCTLEQMITAMDALLIEAQNLWPTTPLMITSVPPVASWVTHQKVINNQGQEFNRWLKKRIADQALIEWIDLNSSLRTTAGHLAPEMTFDGIHLSSKGYEKWCELLMEIIPELSTTR